jgi:hypothetical protein
MGNTLCTQTQHALTVLPLAHTVGSAVAVVFMVVSPSSTAVTAGGHTTAVVGPCLYIALPTLLL